MPKTDAEITRLCNRNRAMRVLKALRTQYGVSKVKGDVKSMITDALADLRHLCDSRGFTFADLDTAAHNHYSTEISGRG